MTVVATSRTSGKHSFDTVVQPFLNEPGLPFSEVLSGQNIQRVFAQCNALFAQREIYSTQVVLWAFLAQVLKDGIGAACTAAVSRIATYAHQMDQPVPRGNTGDYCRARAKLDPGALRQLVGQTADGLETGAPSQWLWRGLHAKLVDGFTFTMMDTEENQARFPQPDSQTQGVGFPIARACVILSLATAAIHDLAVGPYKGKETGEPALLRQMLDQFGDGDVAVFDRCFGSYFTLALLSRQDAQVCTRLHQKRHCDFRKGQRLGKYDHLVTWLRPQRPKWMSKAQYDQIPETMTVRELKFTVTEPGRRTQTITVITTLTDPEQYSKEQIAELYGYRWCVELDIRSIKTALGLDFIRCKSPGMVLRHLWVTLLAYNLIRKLITTAAVVHHKQPRRLSFTLACQEVLEAWILLSTGASRDPRGAWELILERIAAHRVPDRPGRVEPRAVKRRSKPYPLMKQPREALKEKLMRK